MMSLHEILRTILMVGFAILVWMVVMEFIEQSIQKMPKPTIQQEIKKGA